MKFYGNGIVWPVGRFEDGVLETTDTSVIKALIQAGFKHDPEPEVMLMPEDADETIEGQIEMEAIVEIPKAKAVAPVKKVTK